MDILLHVYSNLFLLSGRCLDRKGGNIGRNSRHETVLACGVVIRTKNFEIAISSEGDPSQNGEGESTIEHDDRISGSTVGTFHFNTRIGSTLVPRNFHRQRVEFDNLIRQHLEPGRKNGGLQSGTTSDRLVSIHRRRQSRNFENIHELLFDESDTRSSTNNFNGRQIASRDFGLGKTCLHGGLQSVDQRLAHGFVFWGFEHDVEIQVIHETF
mmetsp:Transcript_94190/g.141137  ORF Transcript_94190/g.141137 Transcript_94190/m.141137 type:complete len:212 (-) Transcript_94190:1035-1670(-)